MVQECSITDYARVLVHFDIKIYAVIFPNVPRMPFQDARVAPNLRVVLRSEYASRRSPGTKDYGAMEPPRAPN